jgi:hypothetical protein
MRVLLLILENDEFGRKNCNSINMLLKHVGSSSEHGAKNSVKSVIITAVCHQPINQPRQISDFS